MHSQVYAYVILEIICNGIFIVKITCLIKTVITVISTWYTLLLIDESTYVGNTTNARSLWNQNV